MVARSARGRQRHSQPKIKMVPSPSVGARFSAYVTEQNSSNWTLSKRASRGLQLESGGQAAGPGIQCFFGEGCGS